MAEKIILASGKGGVGKSSLTAGIACALCSMDLDVLVIDFDIGMGCLDLILDADNDGIFNWGDVIKGNCDKKAVIRATIGPDLIAAPSVQDDAYTLEKVKALVDEYDSDYDYILFDAPAGLNGGFLLAAACADSGIIVSTADEVCVRVGFTAAEKLIDLGVENLKLVINRFNKRLTTQGHYLNIDEVIDATVLNLIGVVPEDKKLSYCSVIGMRTLDKSVAKSAFKRIAKRLVGINVNLKI